MANNGNPLLLIMKKILTIISFFAFFILSCSTNEEYEDEYLDFSSIENKCEDGNWLDELPDTVVYISKESGITNLRFPAMWYCDSGYNLNAIELHSTLSNDTLHISLENHKANAWPGCDCPRYITAIVKDSVKWNYILINAKIYRVVDK